MHTTQTITQTLQTLTRQVFYHTKFQMGLSSLEFAYQSALAGSQAGIYLTAESRTGKSTLIDVFNKQHPPLITPEGVFRDIVTYVAPAKPTPKGLAVMGLQALADPFALKGTEQSLTSRLCTQLVAAKTKMLIIDEAQHLVDKSSRYSNAYHASDSLKNVMSETGVVLVLSGLRYGQQTLNENEALRGRLSETVTLPRFDWKDPDLRDDFLALLETCKHHYAKHLPLPDISTEELGYKLYLASGGLTGYLFKLLTSAALTALNRQSAEITISDLDIGYKKSVSSDDQHSTSPFAKSFIIADQSHMERAARIGLRSDDYIPRIITRKPMSLREAFA